MKRTLAWAVVDEDGNVVSDYACRVRIMSSREAARSEACAWSDRKVVRVEIREATTPKKGAKR